MMHGVNGSHKGFLQSGTRPEKLIKKKEKKKKLWHWNKRKSTLMLMKFMMLDMEHENAR